MKKFFSEPRLVIKLFDNFNRVVMSVEGNDDFGGQGTYDPEAQWQD